MCSEPSAKLVAARSLVSIEQDQDVRNLTELSPFLEGEKTHTIRHNLTAWRFRTCAQSFQETAFETCESNFSQELFVVSRLDRPTSGLLPLARGLHAMNWLQACEGEVRPIVRKSCEFHGIGLLFLQSCIYGTYSPCAPLHGSGARLHKALRGGTVAKGASKSSLRWPQA